MLPKEQLTDAVRAYFTGVLEKFDSLRTSVDELAAAIDQTQLRIHKIRCQIPALADKQFIENCIAEEKIDTRGEETRDEDSEKAGVHFPFSRLNVFLQVDNSEAESLVDLAKEVIDSFLEVFPNGEV
ncbi:hypothetical protein TTRE_0000874201 [Trichuris trichiura]|uniref:Uncharacterized protein n=1 Tax=Trichuris trichiura TaxID=36087 RepID=A0A077ZNU5_TRITR|nr:hypothetical protein TTRE_0000874201 [Trichuris trichiura]